MGVHGSMKNSRGTVRIIDCLPPHRPDRDDMEFPKPFWFSGIPTPLFVALIVALLVYVAFVLFWR